MFSNCWRALSKSLTYFTNLAVSASLSYLTACNISTISLEYSATIARYLSRKITSRPSIGTGVDFVICLPLLRSARRAPRRGIRALKWYAKSLVQRGKTFETQAGGHIDKALRLSRRFNFAPCRDIAIVLFESHRKGMASGAVGHEKYKVCCRRC